MRTERKHWVALATLLIIFSGVAAAASTYELTLDPAVPGEGSTVYVTVLKDGNPEPGIVVQFAPNGGLPIFNVTDAEGKARFKPLDAGSLDIYATTADGTPLAEGHVAVSAIVPTPTTPTPTPAQTTSRSTSGSGGGDRTGGFGVVSSEPLENIVRAETRDGNLVAGKPVTYKFSSPEHGIYEIVVTGKVNEYDISLRVEALKGSSKLVPVPGSGKKHFNIWSGTKNMQEALIRFRLDNAWLASEGISGSDIRLLKWDGTSWKELGTSEINKDSTYTYFESLTPTFSHFAVGTAGAAVPTATAAADEAAGTTGVSETTSTGKPAATAAEEAPAPSSLYWILYVLIAIVVVSAVYLLTRKSKPK